MSESVKNELFVFGISLLTGLLAGLLFDFFRAMRRMGEKSGARVMAEDIFLWISEACLVFAAIYSFNSGQVRFYFFLGMGIGFVLYLLTVSFIFIKLWVFLYKILHFLCQKTLLLCRFLLKPIMFLTKFTQKIFLKIKKRGKKLKKQLKMY